MGAVETGCSDRFRGALCEPETSADPVTSRTGSETPGTIEKHRGTVEACTEARFREKEIDNQAVGRCLVNE